MRGDSGVAGEGRVVGVPKFHSWGKCTMPLTNSNSDWMSKASSRLCNICWVNNGNTCPPALCAGEAPDEKLNWGHMLTKYRGSRDPSTSSIVSWLVSVNQ